MKLKIPLTISNLQTWEDLRRFVSVMISDVVSLLNGKVDLVQNCSTSVVSITFPTANATNSVQHTLGHVPNGYIVISKLASGDVYDGNQENTTQTIFLRCTVATTVRLLVF